MERVYAVWIGRNTASRGTDDLARSVTALARVAVLQRIAPEALLKVNREAFARVVDSGLDQDEHVESAASALEAASKHAEEAQRRWARHARPTEGWAWDKLTAAYETCWDTVDRTTGFFLEVPERRGVELPRPT